MFVTDILSLKGLFLCHLLMGKTAFCPDGSLLAQLANPTHFPNVLFPREKSSYHSSNIQRNGMEKVQARKKITVPKYCPILFCSQVCFLLELSVI